jgi:hypothetical protein
LWKHLPSATTCDPANVNADFGLANAKQKSFKKALVETLAFCNNLRPAATDPVLEKSLQTSLRRPQETNFIFLPTLG